MRSLFIGNIDNVVKEVIKYFDEQGNKKLNDIYRKGKLNYKKLFFSKKYDNVFYFSSGFNDDMDDLNNFLQLVDNSNDVKKYIYVVRGSEFNIDSNNEKVNIIKEIFLAYSKSKNKNILIIEFYNNCIVNYCNTIFGRPFFKRFYIIHLCEPFFFLAVNKYVTLIAVII